MNQQLYVVSQTCTLTGSTYKRIVSASCGDEARTRFEDEHSRTLCPVCVIDVVLSPLYGESEPVKEPATASNIGESSAANPKQANGDKKVKVQYIPPSAIVALGEALGEGGTKYGPFNWRDKPVEALTYVGGMLRHLLAYIDGEDMDPEGNKPHLAGLMANAAILVDAAHCGTLIDNRPKLGHAGQKIRELAGVSL